MSASYLLRRILASSWTDDGGLPSQHRWIGDQSETVCIDPKSKRIYAHIWHDGYRKFYPTIYVSMAQAIRLFGKNPTVSLKFHQCMFVAVELCRLTCFCMEEAIEEFEAFMKEHEVI